MTTSAAPIIRRVSIYPLARPAPANNLRLAEDRDQAACELRQWHEWPYEVEVELEDGHLENYYGTVGRAWLLAWTATL